MVTVTEKMAVVTERLTDSTNQLLCELIVPRTKGSIVSATPFARRGLARGGLQQHSLCVEGCEQRVLQRGVLHGLAEVMRRLSCILPAAEKTRSTPAAHAHATRQHGALAHSTCAAQHGAIASILPAKKPINRLVILVTGIFSNHGYGY